MDESFKVQTDSMGDIHHFAWRANKANESTYLNPRDTIRYGLVVVVINKVFYQLVNSNIAQYCI